MIPILLTVKNGLILSVASSLVFIGGMYLIGSIRVLSHSFPVSIFLFCIPLFIYSLRIKPKNLKNLFFLILWKSIWIVAPVCLIVGWVFATFQMNEFDVNTPFDFQEFILFSTMSSIPLFVITFVTLFVGSGISFYFKKKIKNQLWLDSDETNDTEET